MKTLWSLIFFASALFLFCCAFTTLKRKTHTALLLRITIILAAVSVAANAAIAACSRITLVIIPYTIYSISSLWMLYFFLAFAYHYVTRNALSRIFRRVCAAVIVLDNLSYIANIVLHHAYTITTVARAGGELYFKRIPLAFGVFHLWLSYLLLFLTLAVIIRQMIRTPSIYWARFVIVLCFTVVAAGWEVIYIFSSQAVNLTVIGITVITPLFVYFTQFYKPRLIIDRMLSRVVSNLNDMVLFFNIHYECIYANKLALNFFDTTEDELEKAYERLTEWFKGMHFNLRDNPCTFICTNVWHGSLTHLKVSYDKLYEHGRLIGSFFHIQDITTDVNRSEVQEFKATHDELTGLYNRTYLFQRIHRALLQNLDKEFYIIVTDIKDFKLINDIFGRDAGDEVLINSARSLREYFRGTALYGRINHDRFCVMITEEQLAPLQEVFIKNQLTLSEVSIRNANYPIVVHGGIYPVTQRGLPVVTMVDHAIIAIDSIKHSREVRMAYYNDKMRDQLRWEQRIIGEIDSALKNREFEIYLQPQADSAGTVRGAEVLVRWNHHEKGLLPPAEFVPVFEKNGQIIKMDLFVWEEACRLLQKWQTEGKNDFYLSVNISPNDFYYIDVHKAFCDLVAKYGINPARLKLEITETVMITDLEQKIQLIDKLHEAGFAVEMDDFGSGYSSLNMLKDIPVDVLKIDMAFLYHAKDVKRSRIIIQQVVVLSKELGIPVITEGVETEEQVTFLRGIGCDMFQGYYFARPLRVDDFESQYF